MVVRGQHPPVTETADSVDAVIDELLAETNHLQRDRRPRTRRARAVRVWTQVSGDRTHLVVSTPPVALPLLARTP